MGKLRYARLFLESHETQTLTNQNKYLNKHASKQKSKENKVSRQRQVPSGGVGIFTPQATHAQAPSHPVPGSCREEQGTGRCKGYWQEWAVIRERGLACTLVSHLIALKFPVLLIFTRVRLHYRPCHLSVIITSVWREAKKKSDPGNTSVGKPTMLPYGVD